MDDFPERSPLDMDPEAMRAAGYRVVDALIERWVGLPDDTPWRGAPRREVEPLLAGPAPETGRPFEEVLARLVSDVLPLNGRIDHPRFFAFVPSSPTWPGILGDLLVAGFNPFSGTWLESSGTSMLELVVLDWFREWIEMPEGSSGLLTSGGSSANLGAIVAAREHAGNPRDPVVYLSDQGHSSLERAARIVGIPAGGIHKIPSDDHFRMRVDALSDAIREDRAAGRTPVIVCANGGTTNTGTVDPLPELARLCRETGVWFHVDAAYGGFAYLADEGKRALTGLGEADSVTLDPHKWLFQPYECGCLLVRDVARLENAFRIFPEYLQDTELGAAQVNFANRGLQLTRSSRAVKIWASVQTFGLGAIRRVVRQGMEMTRAAQRFLEASDDLEVLSPAGLGVVCFRFHPRDAGLPSEELETINKAIQDQIVEGGQAMMSSTRLRGEYSLRLCILNHRTRWSDVRSTLEEIERIGRTLVA